MIDIDTVFILGAGASNPYGYPTGKGLCDDICSTFKSNFHNIIKGDNDNTTYQIGNLLYDPDKFCRNLEDATTPSIDLWLARNPKFSHIGKLAIILSIFNAERDSKFRKDVKSDQDWYRDLYHKMTKSLHAPDSYKNFRNNRVTFITFNYDRSLEHFLYESLNNSFRSASGKEILNELNETPIYHVYGKIADLPWESNIDRDTAVHYLKPDEDPCLEFTFSHLEKLKNNIEIVYERKQSDYSEIHDKISSAKRIFFLGFGYASENLEILNIDKTLNDDQAIFGTALGFRKKEIEDIRNSITSNFKYKKGVYQNPIIEDMNCVSLLKEYL